MNTRRGLPPNHKISIHNRCRVLFTKLTTKRLQSRFQYCKIAMFHNNYNKNDWLLFPLCLVHRMSSGMEWQFENWTLLQSLVSINSRITIPSKSPFFQNSALKWKKRPLHENENEWYFCIMNWLVIFTV